MDTFEIPLGIAEVKIEKGKPRKDESILTASKRPAGQRFKTKTHL
jgi:hypothetical protein